MKLETDCAALKQQVESILDDMENHSLRVLTIPIRDYIKMLEGENAQLNEVADSLSDELHAARDDQQDTIMGNNRLGF